jgi:hypothetical protein
MKAPTSPYTGKVLKKKADAWHHDVSPSLRQERLESLLNAQRAWRTPDWGRLRSSPTSTTGGSSPS